MQNPDPKKYAIHLRKGEPILVDRQILRWRAERRKEEKAAKAAAEALKPFNPFTGT